MKSTELRVGNLVYNGTVTATSDNGVVRVFDGYKVWSSDTMQDDWLQPMDITKEMLIDQFGFKETATCLYHELGAAKMAVRFGGGKAYFEIIEGLYLGEIKHIHRLQNLYQAIMGRELK